MGRIMQEFLFFFFFFFFFWGGGGGESLLSPFPPPPPKKKKKKKKEDSLWMFANVWKISNFHTVYALLKPLFNIVVDRFKKF